MTVIRPPTRPQHASFRGPVRERPRGADGWQPSPPSVAPRLVEPDDGPALLRLSGVHAYEGQRHILRGVSLAVRPGEIVALLGANGAGKTTTLRTIHGFLHPSSGRIDYAGRDISRSETHRLVRDGISQAPERHRVFASMSVLENLQMGAYSHADQASLADGFERVFGLFPILYERRAQNAATLSGGEQQMLAIGRALMARPTLLLLDEPTSELAPIPADQTFTALLEVNRQGVTILLVEQKARLALAIASRAYVLQTGEIVRAGETRALVEDPAIRAAYLGG